MTLPVLILIDFERDRVVRYLGKTVTLQCVVEPAGRARQDDWREALQTIRYRPHELYPMESA